MCHRQKRGHITGDCRNCQRDMKKAITGAVISGLPSMASNSHDYVFAVTARPRLVQAHQQMEESIVLMSITVVQSQCQASKKFEGSTVQIGHFLRFRTLQKGMPQSSSSSSFFTWDFRGFRGLGGEGREE